MPPRLRICPGCFHPIHHQPTFLTRRLSTAPAITPAAPPPQTTSSPPPIARFPPTQPPSHKPPELRKSQLHRQYSSLLRSTPLMLLFQHNNLKATEWMSIRRELHAALLKVDQTNAATLAPAIKMQAIQTGIFESALLVAEYYHPERGPSAPTPPSGKPSAQSSTDRANHTHALSRTAYDAVKSQKLKHALRPLLSGPLAVVAFPSVTSQHLKAALSILSPQAPAFPAPTRRANPGYYDTSVQAGLQKLMLLGARVEGRVLDNEGARWVGGIEGGLDGLRGQLVALLSSVGQGVTGALEGLGRNLWITVDGRRRMLEEEKENEDKKA